MKKGFVAVFALLALTQVNAQEKWTSLFDGKTTAGWHSYGEKTAGAAWKIDNGIISLDPTAIKNGKGGGDLVTDESFNDFHLQLESKISKIQKSIVILFIRDLRCK